MGAIAVVAFLLLLGVVYLAARPLLLPPAEIEDGDQQPELVAQKDRVLDAIREMDMDFATGKLSDDDYRSLRSGYLAEAVQLTKAIEGAERNGAVPSQEIPVVVERAQAAPVAPDDELEREIAARKQALLSRSCPTCSAERAPDDKFCRECGAHLLDSPGGA